MAQLHTGIRIDSINPVHVRITVFTGNALWDDPPHPDEPPLRRLTRGWSGELGVNTQNAEEIILGFPGLVKITSRVPFAELAPLPRVQTQAIADDLAETGEEIL